MCTRNRIRCLAILHVFCIYPFPQAMNLANYLASELFYGLQEKNLSLKLLSKYNKCMHWKKKNIFYTLIPVFIFFHRSEDPLELSFPHIKLASPEDELLNKSLLDSLTPASPSSSAPYRLPKLSCTGSVSSTCTSGSDRSEGALRNGQSIDGLSPRSQQSKKSK